MQIAVTGGAGFIGSHLVERLLTEGHHVFVVDNLSTGKTDFLRRVSHHPQLTFYQDRAENPQLMKTLMEKCDVIYHLAAVLGVKNTVEDPIKVIDGSLNSTRVVLEHALSTKTKVIFASTSEIYGKNPNPPFHEDADRVLGAPSIHRWCYATAKAIDEHLCFAFADRGLRVTVLRYFNTYGPRQTSSEYGGVVSRFIKAALNQEIIDVYGNGLQKRCFTYVDDTVSATLAAIRPEADGKAFNIGSETPITIMELADLIRELADSTSPIRKISYEQAYGKGYEDMPIRIPDITRIRETLDYAPTVSLEEGLKRTIAWYKHEFFSK